MTERNQHINTNNDSRLFPLLIAGLICFVIAVLLGFGSWRVFGSQARERGDTTKFLQSFGIVTPAKHRETIEEKADTIRDPEELTEDKSDVENDETDGETDATETEITLELEGIVEVEGGEFAIGGGETKRPLQRVVVEDFLIAETEVTNSQYAEFIKETGHRAPKGWKKVNFPNDTENFPVVNVSWSDAVAFCSWLGDKHQMNIRLPKQAEWELAARGKNRFVYPWGNEWNDKGVQKKKSSSANPVKSYPENKSPYGAYDMLGNVWEWTSDLIPRKEMVSEIAKRGTSKNAKVYLALGGSFTEESKQLRNTFWAELEANTAEKSLGFRYVIIPTETNNQKEFANGTK